MKIGMRRLQLFILLFATSSLLFQLPPEAFAAAGDVDSTVEINDTTTNGPTLANADHFGTSVANIGDLNGDGVNDLAVGAYFDDGEGDRRGAVHIMFMNTDGSVDSTVEINDTTTNGPTLADIDAFGRSVANIGDLDGDGVNDLVVGAQWDDAGGTNRGAVHIMFMNTDGSVDSTVEINGTTTNGPTLANLDAFGRSVANIGDLNGDGVNDLAVGADVDDGSGSQRGAVHIMFMNTDGSVDSTVEINDTTTNGPTLANGDSFGSSIANIGDLNGDGVNDLAVGAEDDDGSGSQRGAVHIMFMNTDGSVDSTVEINGTTTNGPTLANLDVFGTSVANIGDLDGDGVNDLVVGAMLDGPKSRGAVHIMFMNTDGSVDSLVEINDTTTNGPTLANGDAFGGSIANIGDLNGDGVNDLAVGAYFDAAGGTNRGAVHIMFMKDAIKPTVTITSSSGDSGDTASSTTLSYTATFSESTSNFVVGDITVTGTANGGSPAASNFAGSGTTYTFDVVQGSSDGTVSVSVAAGKATDAAGNDNTVSNTYTFTIDTVGPTVTITSSSGDSGDSTSSTTLSYTATFSESTSNFVVGDITVTGTANDGSPEASNFAGSGTTYTFDVVRGSSGGTVTVKIAADVATDSDGNDNTISNTYELTVESLAFSSNCSKHTLLGNCGTISINNDVYRIAKNWNNFPATEVLVGDPVTITLSIPKKPTYTKISSASVYTEIFGSPKNFDQTAHIDYSIMSDSYSVTKAKLFQVAAATHRIVQDSDVKNLDRFEVVFTMIFAKPMDTSHIVIETKNSSGFPEIIYLTNALKVSERPIYALTLEELSKFELTYKPEIESEPDVKREIEPEPKGICGKGTVLKDNMCVSKEWSFFDFFEQLMKLFG